jgi:hypothetical protein
MRNKTTGRIRIWLRALALPALLPTALVSPPAAAATELALTTSNDIISGEDDLYTAELGVRVGWGEGPALLLGERIFTDRERGIRFDETYATVRATLPPVAGWHAEVGAGVLHVGEGLAGESLQNAVHRVVGSDRVELEYPEGDRWFPSVSLAVERVLAVRSGAALSGRGEIEAVPGFRSLAHAEVLAERSVGQHLTVRAGLGLLGTRVESRWLGDRLRELEPTVRLGVHFRRLALEWGHNLYGTATDHATIAYRVGLGGGGPE